MINNDYDRILAARKLHILLRCKPTPFRDKVGEDQEAVRLLDEVGDYDVNTHSRGRDFQRQGLGGHTKRGT